MIGPFSTTLVPLSSSSSVDRQVLINVEASAISPDERQFGFIFTKIPFTRHSDEEEKRSRSLDQIARTFRLFAPPQKCLAQAATAGNQYTNSDEENDLAVCKSYAEVLHHSVWTGVSRPCPVSVIPSCMSSCFPHDWPIHSAWSHSSRMTQASACRRSGCDRFVLNADLS